MATELNHVASKTFQLFDGDAALWTRENGRIVRDKIEKELRSMPSGSLLEIDATGIEVFDVSFGSEVFAKLVLHLPIEYQGICIAVKGLGKYPEENLDSALNKAGVMMLVKEDGNSWHLAGKFSSVDETTIEALSSLDGPVSVQDLAKHLDIQPTACSERLSRLAQFGLIHRLATDSGRVQYLYSSIV